MRSVPRLYLVRHGETAWSLTGQHTGTTDLPLTGRGEQMARDLRQALSIIDFDRVLVSPRLRAHQTCELAGLASAAQTEPDLAEWDYGDYESLRTVDIRLLQPGWSVWCDGCPGGETPQAVAARADRLIERLLAFEGCIALFSHGQFGRVLAMRWIGLPAAQGRHFVLDPATLSILGPNLAHPAHAGERVIVQWNAPA